MQTTAGLSSVVHDGSLIGNGSAANPLGLALGSVGTPYLANSAVTGAKIAGGAVGVTQLADSSVVESKIAFAAVGTTELAPASVTGSKIANATVVRSLNGLTDSVSLQAGSNVTITPSGNSLTIASTASNPVVAYTTLGQPPVTDMLTSSPVIVISKDVPAGTYLIFYKAFAINDDGSPQDCQCSLSTGDLSIVRLGSRGEADKGIMILHDAATFAGPTTVTVTCSGFKMFLGDPLLTLVKVNSLL